MASVISAKVSISIRDGFGTDVAREAMRAQPQTITYIAP